MKKLSILSAVLIIYSCNSTTNSNQSTIDNKPIQKVSFVEVKKVFDQRCLNCHSSSRPSGNLSFEDNNQIKDKLQKINNRVVVQKNMPPGNSTNMTQEERNLIKNWIDSGASLE